MSEADIIKAVEKLNLDIFYILFNEDDEILKQAEEK